MLPRSVLRSARLAGNGRNVIGRATIVSAPLSNALAKLTANASSCQRSSSSTASINSPGASKTSAALTAAGSVATAVAIGSIAWYYHLFGQDLYAMTPQEEG